MFNSKKLSNIQLSIMVLLRVAIGWHFLYEGVVKLFTPNWSSAEYLTMSRWIFAGFFNWIAATPAVLSVVDFLNVWGLTLIGLGLIFGAFTRTATWAGIILLAFYFVAYPPFIGLNYGVPNEGQYLIVNKTLIEMFALGVLAFLPTGHRVGIDRLVAHWRKSRTTQASDTAESDQTKQPNEHSLKRRELLKSLATLPFFGAFIYTVLRKKSFEEKHLVDAVTSASIKPFNFSGLKELNSPIPHTEIKGMPFSRVILGGNLLSGNAHARDLIYVSKLVKAYHTRDKIFGTLLLAEKCGINTILTGAGLAPKINEYWDRGIGKIQFICDAVGLKYDAKGRSSAAPIQEFMDRIQKAIDQGACACYIQGETADYYMQNNRPEVIAQALDLIRKNKVIAGIGAHRIETIKACVEAGFDPAFWMKTLHHHNYWSAGHPEWHDNLYCPNPEETIAYMKTVKQPWIAFKTMAAGSIHPKDAFRYAFENGADMICAGMYDFQMVEDVNIVMEILNGELTRERDWIV